MSYFFDCTGLFDSHAHYFDRRFELETDGANLILENDVFGSGIDGVINVGTNSVTNKLCIEQAQKHEKMYAAVGIHPEDVGDGRDFDCDIDSVYELLKDEKTRLSNKVVALGEIGFDYHYEGFDKVIQKRYFEAQMSMAGELDIPVIIHDREAHGDCFDTVLKYKNVKGVFHSFSGSPEMALELVKRGWYISFSGVVTFKNARRVGEVAASVPLDRLLVETDAPYLAPHPHRGKRNDSSLMRHTVEALAALHGATPEQMATLTAQNAAALFGLSASHLKVQLPLMQ